MTAIDKLALVEKVWDDGDKCSDCPFCLKYEQSHGEGPPEVLRECEILNARADPWDCPGFEEVYLEALAEERDSQAEPDEGDLPQ